MHILRTKEEQELNLSEHLSKDRPFVLEVASLFGERTIRLKLKKKNNFKAVCASLYTSQKGIPIPRYVTSFNQIPDKTYFILTQDDEGYTLYFCLSHHGISSHLQSNGKEELSLNIVGYPKASENNKLPAMLCVWGGDLYQTINLTIQVALKLTGGYGKLIHEKNPLHEWLGTLGWESGIPLGLTVSKEKVLNAIWSYRKVGIPIGYVVIDEGWQDVLEKEDDPLKGSLFSFEASPSRFPDGIKGLVEDLHRAGIEHVGVWHGFMGARGGIHPELGKRYELQQDAEGRCLLGYELGKTFQFFYDYYCYLRDNGISFIKIGDQTAPHRLFIPGHDITGLYQNLQNAIQATASLEFGAVHFNDNCLENENLWYWTSSHFVRVDEDLDLENPFGIKRMIRNSLFNSFWLHPLMLPDMGGWVSGNTQSDMMATFQAISGTVDILGDVPGSHNAALIQKLITPSGKLLKVDSPLRLCADSVFINPLEEKRVYKAFSMKGNCGVVGVFNLTSGKWTLNGKLSPKDVEGLEGDRFAIYSNLNGFVTVLKYDEELDFFLKPNQCDIFILSPIQYDVAVFGCYDYLLPPGPINKVSIEEESVHVYSNIKAPMILYCARPVLEARCNGKVIPWELGTAKPILSLDARGEIVDTEAEYAIIFE